MAGGSRAGQANEAGSVHRRGVAAYLAAHGLASWGLPAAGHAVNGPSPIGLGFETDQPTDDINCILSDGSRLFVSAKRACGNDRHLKNTVEQWVAQAATLNDGDRLVLATAEPKGIVKDLGTALLRRRVGSPTYPPKETEALRVLEGLLSSEPEIVRERVLDAAYVLKIDATEAGRSEFDVAAALLEGMIVPRRDGAKSIRALSEAMHTEAGKAFASGVDDWVRVLLAADVEVFADGQGPAGAVARARQAALEAYRAQLGRYDGVVDLSLLADDLPPLIVQDMAENLRVSVPDIARSDEQALLVLARRWTRMLLVGLPGAGKTTALRQLAARWARDCRAPIPILVSLRPVCRRCEYPGAVTLSVICEVATLDMESGQRADLAAALESACQEGRAVLLLDGLDECMNRRAVVTEGLRVMLESLPAETGVILATRSSGAPAAERLRLPTAQLETPRSLDDVLRQLLRHVAAVRVAEPQRDAWAANRIQWLEDTRKAHRDIGAVPLLATLLALVAADSTDEQLPNDRATLLMTAVHNSVRRWERHRLGSTEDIAIWPSDGQLLDGYAALGHLLSVSGEVRAEDASACISAMLASRWDKAPGPAEELADRILWFWDEHVGVFIGTNAGTVVPRSRVFTEIAAAMWAKRLPDEALTHWVTTSLSEADQRLALLLAAEVEPRVMALLMADRDSAKLEVRTLLAAEALRRGVVLASEQLESLLDRLASAAAAAYSLDRATGSAIPISTADKSERSDVEQSTPKAVTASNTTTATEHLALRDGHGWTYTYELARLPLPRKLRHRRQALLDSLALSDEQRIVSQALCALSDAARDERPLDDEIETAAIRRLLDLPLPDKTDRLRREPRRRVVVPSTSCLLIGHVEAAVAAPRYLDVLDYYMAQRIRDIATWSSLGTYREVIRVLADRGHRFEKPAWQKALGGLTEFADPWDLEQELPFLRAVAQLSNDDVEMSVRSWRLLDLCDLCAVLDMEHADVEEFVKATTIDTDDVRQGWLCAAAVAAELDIAAVAAQARLAITERGDDDGWSTLDLLLAPASGPRRHPNGSPLSVPDQMALVAALSATSEWIAHSAAKLLSGARGEQLRERLLEAMPRLPAPLRSLAAGLACYAADDPVNEAAQLLKLADPAACAGATRYLSLLLDPNEQAESLLARARVTDDLTIRLAAIQDQQPVVADPPVTHWSCLRCAAYNDLAEVDCRHCDRGTRPKD